MRFIVKNEKDWLEIRKKYVTASNAATLVGLNPYSSPSKLRNPPEFTGNAFTKVGQILEPVVVNITNEVLGKSFKLYELEKEHKEFFTADKLGATPDAHMNNRVLLECKTTRPQTYIKYSEVPPNTYLIQLMVQLFCTNIKEGYLSILSTDLTQKTAELVWPISIFKVLKNDRICGILSSEAERFMKEFKFRVNSKLKKEVQLLLPLSYEKIL